MRLTIAKRERNASSVGAEGAGIILMCVLFLESQISSSQGGDSMEDSVEFAASDLSVREQKPN